MSHYDLKKLSKRLISHFIDVIILRKLKDQPASGYDLVGFFPSRYRILISSGTIYSKLYAMERQGFIQGKHSERKRIYHLMPEGESWLKKVMESSDPFIVAFKQVILEGKRHG